MQLGRDDNTPLFTWDKTDKLCGEQARQVAFDVPNGQVRSHKRLVIGELSFLIFPAVILATTRGEGSHQYLERGWLQHRGHKLLGERCSRPNQLPRLC